MILVDTSVLIDYLKGAKNKKVDLFADVLKQKLPYGITLHTYQELLQGAKDEEEFEKLKEYLSALKIYSLPETTETCEKAARLFFQLKKQGVPLRSGVDILIALTAMENHLLLLHNDRHFDVLGENMDGLKILKQLYK